MDLNTNYFFRNVIICNVFYGSIARGRIDLVNSFLQLGADPALATGEWNAAKLARSMQHNTVANVLEMYQSEKAESLLQNYKFRYDEDTVNVDAGHCKHQKTRFSRQRRTCKVCYSNFV